MKYSDFDEIFNNLDDLSWKNDVDRKAIVDIAIKNFPNIAKMATKNATIIRLSGQSGSGKTTQLMPASYSLYEKKGIEPIHFAVRNFSELHPEYGKLLSEYGPSEIRERTNGFALRCLLVSITIAIELKYDILFEVTLLTPEFEEFILKRLKKNNYKCLFLCLAVSKDISDYFIEKRMRNCASFEAGRVIFKSSSSFFYDTLIDAMSFLEKCAGEERVIIWDAFHKKPIYDGKIKNSLQKLLQGRNMGIRKFKDELKLLEAKKKYLLKHF